jgi:spermidine/putrescine-binding protein
MHDVLGATSRAAFLRRAAALAAVGALGSWGVEDAAARAQSTTLQWTTWADHFFPQQIAQVKKQTGVGANATLFTDDAAGYLKLKQHGAPIDMLSADALWVTKEYKEKLVQSFDINDIASAKGLYSVAKQVPFWKASDGGYLAYPKGWSMSIIYYNPKYVKTAPTSWEALTDKKYRGKIVAENSASALFADAGVAVGAKDPTNMSSGELSRAKDYLKALKPNILKLVSQGDEVVRALADESAWIGIQWLGTEFRVKAAGGPLVKPAIPKEGTTGWIDGEMLTARSKQKSAFIAFVGAMETPEWSAKLFLKNGHPMLNEKAYKVLVNQGHKELADKSLYNKPELAMKMTLWGPSTNDQAVTDAFNEVFGG